MDNTRQLSINKRSIVRAITEGVLPMQRNYDHAHDDLPFFQNSVTPGSFGNRHSPNYSMSHVPGRWLDALLNAEHLLHLPIDETCVSALRAWTYRSYEDQQLGLPAMLDLDTFQTIPCVDLHNLRESMHALVALITYRDDDRAFTHAKALIQSVDRYFDQDTCTFRYDAFCTETGADERNYGVARRKGARALRWQGVDPNLTPEELSRQMGITLFSNSFGRYIGPLTKLYRATGYAPALDQAIKLQRACFAHVLPADGSFTPENLGAHAHSVTSMISSLAQLGVLVNDRDIMMRVQAFMENGLKELALDFGWCTENAHHDDWKGEANCTSDIMDACLSLGSFGFQGYYARAERILRGHLLPSQALDTSFVDDDPVDCDPGSAHMAWRVYGAFGFPTPTGHEYAPDGKISFNWDITGGAVSGLCAAYRHCVTDQETDGLSINLLFDYEDDKISVSNPYDGQGTTTIVQHAPGTVRMRIPGNTDTASLRVKGCQSHIDGEWLYLDEGQAERHILIQWSLLQERRTYTFRSKSLAFTWQGEEVVSATNHGQRLLFFPDDTDA